MLKTNPGVRITWNKMLRGAKRNDVVERGRKWERWKRLNDKLSMLEGEKVQSHWQLLGFSKLFPPHHQHSGLPDLLESRLPGWTRARVAFSTSGVPAATQVVKVNNCNICSSNIIFQQQQQNVISSSLPDLLKPGLPGWTLNSESNMFTTGSERTW